MMTATAEEMRGDGTMIEIVDMVHAATTAMTIAPETERGIESVIEIVTGTGVRLIETVIEGSRDVMEAESGKGTYRR